MEIKVPITEKTLEALVRGIEPLILVDLEKKEAEREKTKSYLIVDYTLQIKHSDGKNCGTYKLEDVKKAFLEPELFAEYVDIFPCKVTRLANMQIVFDDRWNRTTIINLVESHPYLEFGKHEDLKAVCVCPYAEDGEEDFAPDYEELTFIVPKEWLKEVCKELFDVDDLDRFLTEEYTSDQNEVIFEKALNEGKVVMVDFR